MPRGGRIVNISSISSKLNVPALPFYSAAKAALDSLSVSWAAEVSFLLISSSSSHPPPFPQCRGQFKRFERGVNEGLASCAD